MNFLTHPFCSPVLKTAQAEVNSLVTSSAPVLFLGHSGSGKSSWAACLAKARGRFLVIEAAEAPKEIAQWASMLMDSAAAHIILEDIEKWSEATQFSLAAFLKSSTLLEKSLISTASLELHSRLNKGLFRQDIYQRLSAKTMVLPKLIQCLEDIPLAAEFWLDVHSLIAGRKTPKLSEPAILKLKTANWSGEWNEFINVLEKAVELGEEIIKSDSLSLPNTSPTVSEIQAGLTLAEMEKKLILQTLKLTASNKSQAARLLGISIRTLRNKLKEYRQEGHYEYI